MGLMVKKLAVLNRPNVKPKIGGVFLTWFDNKYESFQALFLESLVYPLIVRSVILNFNEYICRDEI